MAKLEKLIETIRNNYKNVRFGDLRRIAEALGFVGKARKGSHRAFSRRGEPEGLKFQARSGKIPPYQARQLIAMIDKYGDEL